MDSTQADPVQSTGPLSRYAQLLQTRFDGLPERDQQVLRRRALADNPETLDVLGAAVGVTRERVRQLEVRAIKELAGASERTFGASRLDPVIDQQTVSEQSDADHILEEALGALRELPLPVTDGHLVASGFAPLESPGTRMLLAVARSKKTLGGVRLITTEFGGFRWLHKGDSDPADLVAELVGELAAGSVVDDVVVFWDALEQRLRVHTGPSAEAADLTADVFAGLGAVEVSGRYALLGGPLGVNEQIIRILRAHDGPMTCDELMIYLPQRNRRTVENALVSKESPFVRVTRREFYLKDAPGAVRHRPLRQMVYDEVEAHGQVSVQHLQELAEENGHSRASIAFYGMLPGLIEDGGVLRRRGQNDPPAAGNPELDDECFRVVDGTYRGRWSRIAVVNGARLRSGSLELPPPLAGLLGIAPDSRGAELNVNGVHVVRGSWRHSPSLWSRDLKPVLAKLGLNDGDRMRLIEAGPGELVIEKVPELTTGIGGPYRTLADCAGLYDEHGAHIPEGNIVDALTYAVGLPPPVPLVAVERRLRSRRNNDLASALVLLFPDQLVS